MIAAIVFALLVFGIAVTYFALKIKREAYAKTGKHPKGHYIGLGMVLGVAIFTPIGIALSVFTDNPGMIGIGPGIGIAIGLAIGAAWEKKHEKELRPLTKEEERLRRIGIMSGLALLVLGAVTALVLFFYSF